jgi:hypothetical protein
MLKVAIKRHRAQLSLDRYEKTRWLVMTAAALAAFLGFQLVDQYIFGP